MLVAKHEPWRGTKVSEIAVIEFQTETLPNHRQGSLSPDWVTLTEKFYSELRTHPVPLHEVALS